MDLIRTVPTYAALTASRYPPSTTGSRRWFYGVVRGLDSAVLGGMFSYFVLPDAFVMLKTIEENVANAVFMIFE